MFEARTSPPHNLDTPHVPMDRPTTQKPILSAFSTGQILNKPECVKKKANTECLKSLFNEQMYPK